MFSKSSFLSLLALAGLAFAQSNSAYCDAVSGICFSGYTDPDLDITVGVLLPESNTTTEYVIQMIAPATYGYTGVSMGGTMADSLLFVMWPNDDDVVFSTRWTSGYTQPTAYTGPTITFLPNTKVNSTHIAATFRCQNCTVWEDGSLGSGSVSGFELIAYVAQTTTPVDDPSDPNSDFIEHDQFDFFGCQLSDAQSSTYSSVIAQASGSAPAPTAAPTPTPTPTPTPAPTTPAGTSSAPAATQTQFGQCGGTGWTGPTVCASGSTCKAVSPPYYSQCL